MHFEKFLSSQVIYRGNIVSLTLDTVELQNGSIATREVVHHNGGVAVLPLDDEDNILFVRQFRHPYQQELLELPAGKMEPGEDPTACGMRELEEETGHQSQDYTSLGQVYPTPGYVDEVLHLFLARKLVPTHQQLDEDEFLTIVKIPFQEAVQLCLQGDIKDAKTVVSILKYQLLYRL